MKPVKSSLTRLFPDTTVAAYYDPFSQIVNLSKYTATEFRRANPRAPNQETVGMIGLFEHEFTHWIDHISTLWGQENLILIYNALNARATGQSQEFWRIKTLNISVNRDSFFDYYTEHYRDPNEIIKSPWRYQISSGLRFSLEGKQEDNKPILFMKFFGFDDTPILRVPVSVAAILESNAINSEFRMKIGVAESISDPVEKRIQVKNVTDEWSSILYDRDFALYTSVAHLTSNLNSNSDVIWSYKVASEIGTTVLNIPEDLYDKMNLISLVDQEWSRRIKGFIDIKDKGFAFYNLLKNLVDKRGKSNYNLDDLLSCSGLPVKEELEEMVVARMELIKTKLIDGPFKHIALDLLSKGTEVFKIRGIDGKNERSSIASAGNRYVPSVMFGDTWFDEKAFDLDSAMSKLQKGEMLALDEKYLTGEFYEKI